MLYGWESSFLPLPGHLLWGQMSDFYCMHSLDALSLARAPQLSGNGAQPFSKAPCLERMPLKPNGI